mmetsp:Transcript_45110/g.88254  ORF Transcript_45110/g.88254 Transcript_45110/m.88254 type:complete len:232 (-) Transcript_45110:463-1158(-)
MAGTSGSARRRATPDMRWPTSKGACAETCRRSTPRGSYGTTPRAVLTAGRRDASISCRCTTTPRTRRRTPASGAVCRGSSAIWRRPPLRTGRACSLCIPREGSTCRGWRPSCWERTSRPFFRGTSTGVSCGSASACGSCGRRKCGRPRRWTITPPTPRQRSREPLRLRSRGGVRGQRLQLHEPLLLAGQGRRPRPAGDEALLPRTAGGSAAEELSPTAPALRQRDRQLPAV